MPRSREGGVSRRVPAPLAPQRCCFFYVMSDLTADHRQATELLGSAAHPHAPSVIHSAQQWNAVTCACETLRQSAFEGRLCAVLGNLTVSMILLPVGVDE